MKSQQFYSHGRWHSFSTRRRPLAPKERQRQFLQGVPLVLLPAMFSFPAWILLIHQSRFAHSGLVAGFLFPAFAVMSVVGVGKLLRCFNWRELDLIGAMAFGVLLVLGVMLLYMVVFFVAFNRGDLGMLWFGQF